jgi:cytochrome c553
LNNSSPLIRTMMMLHAPAATVSGKEPGRQPRQLRGFVRAQWPIPLLILLALALPATARIAGRHAATAPRGELGAKLEYCQDCHGPSGQGYYGYYPIPRLAGQQPEYLKNQLQAFIERRRTSNIMFNVAHSLSAGMLTALAERFSEFNPPPLAGARKGSVGLGRQIFEDGLPEVNIAACAACHGPDAHGKDQIPRLAGQLYPYVVKVLINWSRERGQNSSRPDISAVMEPIAHSLNKSQVEAVAAFLSTMR